MTAVTQAVLVVAGVCAIVAAWGLYWAKREREERRTRARH